MSTNQNKTAFYFSQNNGLFHSDVLVVVYEFSLEEQLTYKLTSNNAVVFIKHPELTLENYADKKDINYKTVLKKLFKDRKIFLRLQSECFLGMYGDSHCDCEKQRIDTIEFISKNCGIFIHIPQEAQGWGLKYKANELELQLTGRNPYGKYVGIKTRDEAQRLLVNSNEFEDIRKYDFIKDILTQLGLEKERFVLITSSLKKVNALQSIGLNVEILDSSNNSMLNDNNLSEYLIKILNSTHTFSNEVLDEILLFMQNETYNDRALATFLDIIKSFKNHNYLNLSEFYVKKFQEAYINLSYGKEKNYIIGDCGKQNIQNNFSCKVTSSIFKTLLRIYSHNIFDRVSLERLYYFKNKTTNEMVKIRTSEILKIRDDDGPFFEGQHHAEERIIDTNTNIVIQNDVPKSRLKAYVENSNYNFIKQVEMVTTISEFDIKGVKIFLKRIPTLDYRVMDIYAKKNEIKKLIDKIIEIDSSSILSTITNKQYQEENFTKYNLRFANLSETIQEELEIYNVFRQKNLKSKK